MSDLNNVTLMGRLVRDAEVRQTSSGKNCALFSLVVNRTKKENDQYMQTAHFFNLALFGNRAEGLMPYLKKGQQVVIEGHLEQRHWEKDGEKRSGTEIVVEDLHLAGYKKNESGIAAEPGTGASGTSVSAADTAGDMSPSGSEYFLSPDETEDNPSSGSEYFF